MIVFHTGRPLQQGFCYSRVLLATVLCAFGMLLGLSGFGVTTSSGRAPDSSAQDQSAARIKIAPWVLEQTIGGKPAEFLVILADQAALGESENGKTKKERGCRVRDLLWAKAQTTQGPLLQWLRAHHVEHRPFYIVNAIWVKAGSDVVAELAQRTDVLRIEGNPQIRNFIPSEQGPLQTDSTAAIEQGINYTNAPQVWALGYTGQNVVIAGADTGYRWTHAALKNQYRGWDGSLGTHNYNWHDSIHSAVNNPCGTDSAQPCDDVGHGTHTMGTAVGDDGLGNQIGMAPGAKWIGCRNMDQGAGTPARYMECMEFFLAPYPIGGTPAEGDPSKAPDISTNSWGCPPDEGCSASTLQAAVEAQRAAGILMVAAAGNAGSNCQTVKDPPAIYDAVYSVGALNNGTDTIASFSSRGPVTVDNSFRLKPDISAPGTNVRSSIPISNTSYGTMSGTSMAAPHVAGAVALLWSAQPELHNDVAMTETILNDTATHILSGICDGNVSVSPNNTYGYGRLDIKAAVDRALFRVSDVVRDGSAVTVTFYAGASRTYRLERKEEMDDAMWQSIPGLPDFTATTDGPAQLTDPGGGGGQGFYHVVMLPQ